jgi:uncharacterized 2Fe-2S/4Fe-4S cluster protein (DUF4445 family)
VSVAFTIRFLPDDRATVSDEPLDLFLAAARCDIWVEQPCGSKTICGKCRVRVRDGAVPVTPADVRLLEPAEIADGWRLGCQVTLDGDAVLEIPAQTQSTAAKSFGADSLFANGFEPCVASHVVASWVADETTAEAALDRLAGLIENRHGARQPLGAAPVVLASLVRTLEDHPQVALVVSGREIVAAEPVEAFDGIFGVAVDIGSTSLAAAIVDLATGRVVASQSRVNPQVRYGADIISRIHFAQEHREGNALLHRTVTQAVGEMIGDLAEQAGVATDRVFAVACAGNATMTHAAVGADVRPLGQAPYVGVFTREQAMEAADFGWPTHPRAAARFLPMIGRHVGGDTVAAILACGIDRSEDWQLLVDLGTNTEVVLGSRARMIATSTAAGPAFEGANIAHGMRAAPGAIDRVRVLSDGRLVVGTVGNQPARGLCGSGLIDAVAELYGAGVIAASGYLRSRQECEAEGVASRLLDRLVQSPDGQRAVRLGGEVILTAQDVRQLQLVKGSIAAGIALVMRHAGVEVSQLAGVHIAGTFGSFVRKASALAIGLVPPIDPEHIHFVGNAAGVGARMSLVDARARRRTWRIARRCEYVELAGHPDYEEAFCEAIPFRVGGRR